LKLACPKCGDDQSMHQVSVYVSCRGVGVLMENLEHPKIEQSKGTGRVNAKIRFMCHSAVPGNDAEPESVCMTIFYLEILDEEINLLREF